MNDIIKDFALQLDLHFTADNLYNKWFVPIRDFLTQNVNKSWGGVSAMEIIGNPNLKTKTNKTAVAIACSMFYQNEKALRDFYESQTEEDKEIIEKATWAKFLGYKELNRIYGYPVIWAEKPEKDRYGPAFQVIRSKVLQKWSPFMSLGNTWYAQSAEKCLEQSNPELTFPLLMKEVFSKILPKPEGYYLEAVELPDGTEIFNAEEDIFREFPLIIAYYLQNKIRFTQKGYPAAGSAPKMSKALQLKNFPNEGESGMRALLIAGLLADDFKISSVSESPLTILEQLFKRDFNRYQPSPYLLFHLKGINTFYYYNFRDDIIYKILEIFRKMPIDSWVTFKNLQAYAATHFIDLQPVNSLYELSKLTATNYGSYGVHITTDNMKEYITIPNFAGIIYLLAAFGLMELSVDTNEQQIYSYYEGLRACRLTSLGKYILGLQKEYSLPEIYNETQLLFDENGPLIRIEGNLALGDALLGNYAVKVSENRYQFSPGKFLKDCKSGKDLKNKIALFKQTVGQKLPPFWEAYLNQLIQNSQAIILPRNISILKLPPENKELHRLIAHDNILRPIIIKAEKFYILVEAGNLSTFTNRMKELGYLI